MQHELSEYTELNIILFHVAFCTVFYSTCRKDEFQEKSIQSLSQQSKLDFRLDENV